jgi:hypothetical protein
LKWIGHITQENKKHTQKFYWKTLTFERLMHKWENNKMGLREISYENVKWIEMVLDRIKLQAFFNTVVWFP